MRLSEAIRLGSLAIQNPRAANVETCAIGMACVAVGVERHYDTLTRVYPWIDMREADKKSKYITRIWATFDDRVMDGLMTLEQLCDRIKSWEDELEEKGINVEQVTMVATPEATYEPVSEKTLC